MIVLKGQGASPGAVRGPLFFWTRLKQEPPVEGGADAREERARMNRAQRAAVEELEKLAARCRAEGREEAALLFETHAALVRDEELTEEILRLIESEKCTAEDAVRKAGERFAVRFEEMEDSYMQARAADIRDVAGRINDLLQGRAAGDFRFSHPIILAADDLLPSETVRLDPGMILGFVTCGGSVNSHTAILARSMGIPAVCGVGRALTEEYQGQTAYLDGEAGQLILEPDEQIKASFSERSLQRREPDRELEAMKGREDITLDGKRIMLYCNIASAGEIPAVLEQDGQGVGLFRSEFLYLSSDDLPTEERQFAEYRQAASEMDGKLVIIRTLDLGADKTPSYIPMNREENPALGMRGVRFCLKREELFRTQLRAICRASAYGKIAVMFPMIASVWEVRECRRICREVMRALKREGALFDPEMEIGVMIETPASVLIADELAREVDFFSVGTNDLGQYLMACDRQQAEVNRFFDPHHPSVLRAIAMAAEAAHRAGIWIGVCGELASDLDMLPELIRLGIDELSVAPSMVLPLRREIRKSVAGRHAPEGVAGLGKGDERSV